MQIAIELPDDLGEQLLEMPDMQLFIQNAVEKILLSSSVKEKLIFSTIKSTKP